MPTMPGDETSISGVERLAPGRPLVDFEACVVCRVFANGGPAFCFKQIFHMSESDPCHGCSDDLEVDAPDMTGSEGSFDHNMPES